MRKLLILTVLVFIFSSLSADNTEGMKALSADSTWWSKGLFSLNMGQTSFTNWAPGGDNNVSFNTIFIYDLNYKKDIVSWNNHFDLEYGTMVFINLNETGNPFFKPFSKNVLVCVRVIFFYINGK